MKKVLIGCAVLAVLTGLVASGVVFWGYSKLKDSVATDPARVQAIAGTIMRYDLPGDGVGIFALDMMMRMAIISDRKEDGSLLLVLFSIPAQAQVDPAAQLQQQLRQAPGGGGDFVAEEIHTEAGTLCGEQVTVTVSSGTLQRGNDSVPAVNRAAGFVRNGTGYYAMVISTSDDREERTRQVFDSLRLP